MTPDEAFERALAAEAERGTCPRCLHGRHEPGACKTPSAYGCSECGPERTPEDDDDPTDLAVELYNLSELDADIPHAAMMRVFQGWALDLRICPQCDRAGGQHAAECGVADPCDCCGVWPCAADDHERGEA